MTSSWKKGDLAAVIGGTIESTGKFTPGYSVCKVVEVGKKDLALTPYPKRSYDRVQLAPKSCCVKISPGSIDDISRGVERPKINDLVVGFTSGATEEILSGILYSIEYAAGSPKYCKILCGEELKAVHFERVLVIESNVEQE